MGNPFCSDLLAGPVGCESGARAGTGLLSGPVTPWQHVLKLPLPEGLHLMERFDVIRYHLSDLIGDR